MSIAAHYVPAAYLGHFADAGTSNARHEKLWVLQRGWSEQKELRMDSIAKEVGAYSTSDPAAAERTFQDWEHSLRKDIICAVDQSRKPRTTDRTIAGLRLLNQAIQLHVRNTRHQPAREEYKKWSGQLHQTVLIGNRPGESNEATLARELDLTESFVAATTEPERRLLEIKLMSRRWQWHVLRAPSHACLYTSDGPVHFYGPKNEDDVPSDWLIELPVGPFELFVAATKTRLKIVPKRLTGRDAGVVNMSTLSHAHRMVLSARPMPADDVGKAVAYWDELGETVTTQMDPDVWQGAFTVLENPYDVTYLAAPG